MAGRLAPNLREGRTEGSVFISQANSLFGVATGQCLSDLEHPSSPNISSCPVMIAKGWKTVYMPGDEGQDPF